jgi:ribonuclease HI
MAFRSSLNLACECSTPVVSTPTKYEFYTDGSCTNNRLIGLDNPAGWGFTYRKIGDIEWTDSNGIVVTKTDHHSFVGAEVGSNNTAELQAVIEVLDYIERYGFDGPIQICVDSQYVLDIIQDLSVPMTNVSIIEKLTELYYLCSTRIPIILEKVKSHTGIEGNERADRLAAMAIQDQPVLHSLGRFSHNPPRSFKRGKLPASPQWFKEMGLEQKKLF